MSLIRTGNAPGQWRDEGPNRAYSPTSRHAPRPAVTIADMRRVIRGSVLSQTRDKEAHAVADARLRQAYSIHPENRYPDDAA